MSNSDDDNISRSPSTTLFFDEEDSSSEHSGSTGPRRRCSFVSSDRPVMDLRYPESVSGDKSYDLSVCSGNSFSTINTGDDALEKMGMFEVALSASAGLKKKDDEGILRRSNSYPDETKIGWLNKCRMKRHSLDHHGVHSSAVLPVSGDDDDSCVTKKSKNPRKKACIRRCVQAAAALLLLSTVTASFIFFEIFDSDRNQLSFRTEISRTMGHLFGLSPVQEVRKIRVEQEVDRVMAQQLQSTIHEASINEAPLHEEPPIEYDQFFVQAFRNNQKISHRLDNDPMRQRKTLQSRTNVNQHHHVDKVAQVRIQEFHDNQKLAREGSLVTRRRLDESESEELTNQEHSNGMAKRERTTSLTEDLDLTMEWFLQIQYEPPRKRGDNAGGLRMSRHSKHY